MTNVANKLVKTSNKGAGNFLHRVMKAGTESLLHETNFNDGLNGENQKFGLEKINIRKISSLCCCFSDAFLKIRPP